MMARTRPLGSRIEPKAVAAEMVHVRVDRRDRRRHRHHGFDRVAALGEDRAAGFDGGEVRRADDAAAMAGAVQIAGQLAAPLGSRACATAHPRSAAGRETPCRRRRDPRAAGCIDRLAQPLRRRRIENVAGLLEGREGIGIEHFRPHVAVIGRRHSRRRRRCAAKCGGRCRMAISSGMPMRDSALSLERRGVDALGGRQRMEFEIDQARGDVLDRGKALVEISRREEPLQQLLRHRLAGLVVPREAAQHVGLFAASARKAATAIRRNRWRRLVPEIFG